jgi:hypothetical protein
MGLITTLSLGAERQDFLFFVMNHPAISTGILPIDLWWLATDDTHPPFRPAVRENDVGPDD